MAIDRKEGERAARYGLEKKRADGSWEKGARPSQLRYARTSARTRGKEENSWPAAREEAWQKESRIRAHSFHQKKKRCRAKAVPWRNWSLSGSAICKSLEKAAIRAKESRTRGEGTAREGMWLGGERHRREKKDAGRWTGKRGGSAEKKGGRAYRLEGSLSTFFFRRAGRQKKNVHSPGEKEECDLLLKRDLPAVYWHGVSSPEEGAPLRKGKKDGDQRDEAKRKNDLDRQPAGEKDSRPMPLLASRTGKKRMVAHKGDPRTAQKKRKKKKTGTRPGRNGRDWVKTSVMARRGVLPAA